VPQSGVLRLFTTGTQKHNGRFRGRSALLVEVARIELASGSTPQSGLHA